MNINEYVPFHINTYDTIVGNYADGGYSVEAALRG